jgi:hypothetical protein
MGMKWLGIGLVIVALAVGAIPFFNNCTAQGLFLTTAAGKQIDMKCFWTSRAALGVALPLAAVGIMLAMSKRKETQRSLAVTGGVLSAVAIALPTVLIGVCAMEKSCKLVMQPSLILLGTVGLALSAVTLMLSMRGTPPETVA